MKLAHKFLNIRTGILSSVCLTAILVCTIPFIVTAEQPSCGPNCSGGCGKKAPEKDDHSDHDHDDHKGHDHTDDHTGHAQAKDDHEGHDHGVEEKKTSRLTVTKKQLDQLEIKTAPVTMSTVSKEIRVPGEIKVNSDRVAHVVPRAAGIARKVDKALGSIVMAGETLAVIESEELANAKLDFYAKETEVGCCEIKLPRAKEIYENVAKLIDLLEKDAPEKEIKKLEGLEMGTRRGQLLTAHASYISTRITYEQESALRAKKISSERELLNAETAMKQARAKFQAMTDTARYETLIEYSEALQERQVAGFNSVASEKLLRLKGADEKVIEDLRKLVPSTETLEPCKCDNPDCAAGKLPALDEVLGKDKTFAWYALSAPISGTLIEKHIVIGESIDISTEVFTIADLSSVWVSLAVSQDNISSARKGHKATILFPDGSKASTEISFVSPVVDQKTRTVLARATLENPDDLFRPGTFIEALIRVPSNKKSVIVPKHSIQLIEDHPYVFVRNNNGFELREVKTGISDQGNIEILKGLVAGEIIATENAFHLKSEYIKSAGGERGAHEGHSH